MSEGRPRERLLVLLVAVTVLAGCDAGPGTQPLADAVAQQCAQARAMDELASVGAAFVAAVARDDDGAADALVTQSQDLWFRAQSGIRAQPDGSSVPDAFWARQDALAAARPRFELFKAVIAATPTRDAAAGTERMLPEMRALLASIDVSECAPVGRA